VNDGWTVVREPLNVEHGDVEAAPDGLADVSIMMHQATFMATAIDTVGAKVAEEGPDGRRLIETARWHPPRPQRRLEWRRRCRQRVFSAGWRSRRRCATSRRT
jgi:hypothetical protein